MNDIIRKENLQINIDRLDAQRHLYSKVKIYVHLLTFLCVVVPMGIAVSKVIWSEMNAISKGAVIYSFVMLFLRPCLKSYTSSLQKLAARIQQQFDCDVFDLEWNEPLCGKEPIPEQIFSEKTGKKRDSFTNWYEQIVGTVDRISGVVVCQRINVTYDRELRKTFSIFINLLFFIAILIVLVIGVLQNSTVWNWFLNAIVPVSPIFSWYIDLRKQNNKNITALERLDQLVDSALQGLKHGENIGQKDIETIQNFMFLHRSTSYVIPDFIYKIRRNRFEATVQYSVTRIIEELAYGRRL